MRIHVDLEYWFLMASHLPDRYPEEGLFLRGSFLKRKKGEQLDLNLFPIEEMKYKKFNF